VPLWVGIVTLAAGVALLVTTRLERAALPRWMPRLALGVSALGLATLAARQPGLAWSISAIAFSLVAIVLIVLVLLENLRR
jgi:hypothetical protein